MHTLLGSLLSALLLVPLSGGWLGVYLAADKEAAVITEVIPGAPADKAGLRVGDVLLCVDGKDTPTREEFLDAIKALKAGHRVSIKLLRGKRESVVVGCLNERPKAHGAGSQAPRPQSVAPGKSKQKPPAPRGETSPPRIWDTVVRPDKDKPGPPVKPLRSSRQQGRAIPEPLPECRPERLSLERELQQILSELRELRRILEQLRCDKKDAE